MNMNLEPSDEEEPLTRVRDHFKCHQSPAPDQPASNDAGASPGTATTTTKKTSRHPRRLGSMAPVDYLNGAMPQSHSTDQESGAADGAEPSLFECIQLATKCIMEARAERTRLRDEEQAHCAEDIDAVADLHAAEARRKGIIKDQLHLLVPDFVVRVKQLRFLRNQVQALIKGHKKAIDEEVLYEAASGLIKEWDALMSWHRARTLEGMARYELRQSGKLDSECQARYLLSIEHTLYDEEELQRLTQRDLTVTVGAASSKA